MIGIESWLSSAKSHVAHRTQVLNTISAMASHRETPKHNPVWATGSVGALVFLMPNLAGHQSVTPGPHGQTRPLVPEDERLRHTPQGSAVESSPNFSHANFWYKKDQPLLAQQKAILRLWHGSATLCRGRCLKRKGKGRVLCQKILSEFCADGSGFTLGHCSTNQKWPWVVTAKTTDDSALGVYPASLPHNN